MRQRVTGIDDALDQYLDQPAALLVSEQAGTDDARVVEDEQVARGEQRGQIRKAMVGEPCAVDVLIGTCHPFHERAL